MADEFFGEDPFESIINNFFGRPKGNGVRRRIVTNESEDRVSDYVEDKDNVFLIFDLPGYKQGDVDVSIKGDVLNIVAQNKHEVQSYLAQKLNQPKQMQRALPEKVNTKKMSHTFRNGILEVKFPKKMFK